MATSAPHDGTTAPLRTQLTETFEPAAFPVCGPAALLRVIAGGPPVFVASEGELAALELALAVGESLSFPYHHPDALVDDVLVGFRRSSHG